MNFDALPRNLRGCNFGTTGTKQQKHNKVSLLPNITKNINRFAPVIRKKDQSISMIFRERLPLR
jgi:hypothetical protein